MNGFYIYNEIIVGRMFDDINASRADSDKIKQFISKYGIMFRDDYECYIFDFCHKMTKKQIKYIMSFKPSPIVQRKDMVRLINVGVIHWQSVYILKHFLKNDANQFLFITKLVHIPDINFELYGDKEMCYLDYLRYIERFFKDNNRDFKYGREMIRMLENHEKRYYRLFDLMKHRIE